MDATPGGNAPFFVDREVIVLTANGVWIADGTEITHEPTRRLFARSLVREGDGYILKIGRETKQIVVKDTAYFVRRIDGSAEKGFDLLLSDDTTERLDPGTLAYRPGRLVCKIKKGEEDAKFLHAPYFELLTRLEEDGGHYFITLEGRRINLAPRTG